MVLGTPFIGEPGSVCTQTYLVRRPFDSKDEAESVQSYLATRFFRFLVSLRKITQDATQRCYSWVPDADMGPDLDRRGPLREVRHHRGRDRLHRVA